MKSIMFDHAVSPMIQALSGRSGCTVIQSPAPTTASAAAIAKEVVQPKRCATQGVSEAVTAPPICAPMLTMLENTPELRPAISAETDQNELCETYSAPAPPARMTPANCGLCTLEPSTRKTAVNKNATAASPQRPTRSP